MRASGNASQNQFNIYLFDQFTVKSIKKLMVYK